jgi:hypothetical protein
MSFYFCFQTRLVTSLRFLTARLDIQMQAKSMIWRRFDGVPQGRHSWDSPHSARVDEQIEVLPPQLRGNAKLLGGQDG